MDGVNPVLLVLDGDGRNMRLLAVLLRADGQQVETCQDGAEAVARVARPPWYHALILDLRAPHDGELETIRRVHAVRPDLSIFLITAHPQLARSFEPSLQGQLRVFVKPLDYPTLLGAVRGLTTT